MNFQTAAKCIAFLFVVAFFPRVAMGHFLWLEEDCRDGKCSADLYFGEYHQNKKETRDGRLAERKGTKAFAKAPVGPTQVVNLVMGPDRFRAEGLDGREGGYRLVAIDDQAPVADLAKYGLGIVRPIYYASILLHPARESRGWPKAPPLKEETLSIQPVHPSVIVAGKETTLEVRFRGAPVDRSRLRMEVRIYAPNGWSWEGELSTDGKVTFAPLWEGRYVAEAILREEERGVFQGKPYEAVRHRATLSFVAEKSE